MKNFKHEIFTALFFTLIYRLGSFSRIPFADCVGQILDAKKQEFIFRTYAPAHFLYSNTLVLLKKVFYSISEIEISRWLVILSAVFSLILLQRTLDVIYKNKFFALIGTFIFGFGFSFWRNAEIVEVYTFNLLCFMLFVYFLAKAWKQNTNYLIYANAFLGLSLWIHILNMMFIPGSLIITFFLMRNKPKFQLLLNLALPFIFFGALFIFPFVAGRELKEVFGYGENTWISDSLHKSFVSYLLDVVKALFYLFYNYWYFTIAIFYGLFLLIKNDKNTFLLSASLVAPILGFATIYAVSDNYVFFINGYVVLVIWLVYGLISWSQNQKRKMNLIVLGVALVPFIYWSNAKLVAFTPIGEKIEKEKGYKGGISYYLTPWMNNNVGIIEFTLDKKIAPENIVWMTLAAQELIDLYHAEGLSDEEIRNK